MEAENKKYAVEMIDKKIIGYLRNKLDEEGIEYKMMILPDHPTPISLKTHVSDPIPYIIYDPAKEENTGKTYNEKNAEHTGNYIEQGYKLMAHFLDKE